MFGESDSESPRAASPWTSLMAGLPLPSLSRAELEMKTRLANGIPKLVPEVEYGNVEYKLKLLSPSPERFTRLVTQMKWRLLEGGGQAYYELGVADSGQLVGLPRKDLEQSLETLEMMAGDIGASVIVVKEIEIPAALVGLAMNFELGIPQRTPVPVVTLGEVEIGAITETETSATEDDDPITGAGLDTPPNDTQIHPIAYRQSRFISATRSHPERPVFQSSPAINPALADTSELDVDGMFHLDFEIEIASVYKPRPHRSRPTVTAQSNYTKRGTVPKPKKLPQQHARNVHVDPAIKAGEKRMKREARRDQRRRALLMTDVGFGVDDGTGKSASVLQDFHVESDPSFSLVESQPTAPRVAAQANVENTFVAAPPEPRLIVEALVVRKLALEEAFLDFGGFALEI